MFLPLIVPVAVIDLRCLAGRYCLRQRRLQGSPGWWRLYKASLCARWCAVTGLRRPLQVIVVRSVYRRVPHSWSEEGQLLTWPLHPSQTETIAETDAEEQKAPTALGGVQTWLPDCNVIDVACGGSQRHIVAVDGAELSPSISSLTSVQTPGEHTSGVSTVVLLLASLLQGRSTRTGRPSLLHCPSASITLVFNRCSPRLRQPGSKGSERCLRQHVLHCSIRYSGRYGAA